MRKTSPLLSLGQSQLAWLVFVLGMLLTLVAWHAAATRVREEAEQEFSQQIGETLDTVRARVGAYVQFLHGARGLFAASQAVTRAEFRRYIEEVGFGARHPGIHSFAFLRRVKAHEKAEFERRVRRDTSTHHHGYPTFSITPAGERSEYHVIEFIEPEERFHYLLGVDRAAQDDTRETLERARDSGLPAASGRLRSAVENTEATGFFLIALPVYRNGGRAPEDVAARRNALIGYVAARVELESLLKGIVGHGSRERIHWTLSDLGIQGGAPPKGNAAQLHASHELERLERVAFSQRLTEEIAGRRWELAFHALHDESRTGSSLPSVVLVGGCLSSGLLFALVLSLVSRERRIADEVVRQKSLFSRVLDALPINVFLKDHAQRFVLVNDESARTAGMRKDEMIGKTVLEVFPPRVATTMRLHDEQAFAGSGLLMREEILTKDGTERVMLVGKESIRVPGSEHPMLLGFSVDITPRKLAETALRESEERLRAIIDNTTSLIFVKDLDGRYLLINSEFEKRVGRPRDEILGKTDHDLYPAALASEFGANDMFALRAAHAAEFEEAIPNAAGRRTCVVVKFALRNTAGEPYAIAGVATDITERLALEQEAERARANELSRALIDAVGEGLIGVDAAHRVVFANPMAQEILGVSEKAMLGLRLDDVLDTGDEHGGDTRLVWQLVADGQGYQSDQWSLRRPGGGVTPISLVIAPMTDAHDGIAAVASFQNITLRKRAESALGLALSQQKAFLDNLPEMAWLKDTESRYIMANEPTAAACGRTPDEMVGGTDFDFWPAELAELYRADDRLVMANGKRKQVIEPFEGADGMRRWIETIKSPIRDASERIVGTVGTARDVTDRLRTEGELGRHMAELARVNAELDEFTFVASHDLQEPVRKLVAFSDLLRKDLEGDLPVRAEQDLKFITDAALRMQRLVKDLLALSRTGKMSMVRENVALDHAVDLALEALALRIEESGAVVERAPLPIVWGDLTLLTQLYQNLIGNALKFVDAKAPNIAITAEPTADGWVFGVRDNGIGLDTKYAESIFLPFKRLHGQGKYDGSGVGLTVCRKVVERHNGRIWVESAPGAGAWFKFTLEYPPQAR